MTVKTLGTCLVTGQVGMKVVPCITEVEEGAWAPSATLVMTTMIPLEQLNMHIEADVAVSTVTVFSDEVQVSLDEERASRLATILAEELASSLSREVPKTLHLLPLENIATLVDEQDRNNGVKAIYLGPQDESFNTPSDLH